MMLSEVVAVGTPKYLALDDWGRDRLRYLALGDYQDRHRATVVFDPESTEVWALEIFDPEGFTWTWTRPQSGISLEGRALDTNQALISLGYLLKDPTSDPT
jgi:hypothetical protein